MTEKYSTAMCYARTDPVTMTLTSSHLFKEFLDMAEASPDSLKSSHSVLELFYQFRKKDNYVMLHFFFTCVWFTFALDYKEMNQRRPGVLFFQSRQLYKSSSQGNHTTHLEGLLLVTT